jgi:midasin
VANVHGILLLRSPGSPGATSPLIHTPTVIQSLRALATHLSLRLPTLLTSPSSSGKSLQLSYLAATLHPGVNNQIINIHLADTSLDPRSLLGAYVSSPTKPGTFEWKEGVLVRAMREGRWVVFKDIDRGSNEVLGVIKPLVESLRLGKWIGGLASLDLFNRGRVVAHENFALFATRSLAPSRNSTFPPPVFFGAHKFHEVLISSPTSAELTTIIEFKFPRLAGHIGTALIRLWDAVRTHGPAASARDVGYRELEKLCSRVDNLLGSSHQPMDELIDSSEAVSLQTVLPHVSVREEMYLDARDIFFGAGTPTTSARAHAQAIATTVAEHLGLELERRDWILQGRTCEFQIEKDMNGKTAAIRFGRTRLLARQSNVSIAQSLRPFAMHRPAVLLISRIATALSLGEPVLLTGETGTGKTSVITHLAALLNRPLISLNLSHQTESSDLVGGFKPVDARIPGLQLHEQFLELFGKTFSRRKNAKFEESVRKAVLESKWKRAVGLWKESVRLAKERILAKQNEQLV